MHPTAMSRYALVTRVAIIPDDFVTTLANDIMRAMALTAAVTGAATVAIGEALFVTIDEVSASLLSTAPAQTFEVVIAKVIEKLLALQTHTRMLTA